MLEQVTAYETMLGTWGMPAPSLASVCRHVPLNAHLHSDDWLSGLSQAKPLLMRTSDLHRG